MRQLRKEMWKATKEKAQREHPEEFETYKSLTIQRHGDKEPFLTVWRANAYVPIANYVYRTLENREIGISRFKQDEDAREKGKALRKAQAELRRAEFKSKIGVGTILYSSWGYDQTNIDYYQVTRKKGEFVWIREIAQSSTGQDRFMSEMVTPKKDHFIGEEMRKKIGNGALSLNSYSWAWLWDGEPKNATHYA